MLDDLGIPIEGRVRESRIKDEAIHQNFGIPNISEFPIGIQVKRWSKHLLDNWRKEGNLNQSILYEASK